MSDDRPEHPGSCCFRIQGSTARVIRTVPKKLVSKIALACSMVLSSAPAGATLKPALLTADRYGLRVGSSRQPLFALSPSLIAARRPKVETRTRRNAKALQLQGFHGCAGSQLDFPNQQFQGVAEVWVPFEESIAIGW